MEQHLLDLFVFLYVLKASVVYLIVDVRDQGEHDGLLVVKRPGYEVVCEDSDGTATLL